MQSGDIALHIRALKIGNSSTTRISYKIKAIIKYRLFYKINLFIFWLKLTKKESGCELLI
jgi:hypothetical protein